MLMNPKDEFTYVLTGSMTRSTEIFDFVVLLSLLGNECELQAKHEFSDIGGG